MNGRWGGREGRGGQWIWCFQKSPGLGLGATCHFRQDRGRAGRGRGRGRGPGAAEFWKQRSRIQAVQDHASHAASARSHTDYSQARRQANSTNMRPDMEATPKFIASFALCLHVSALTLPAARPPIQPSISRARTHPHIHASLPPPSTAHLPTPIHMLQSHAPCTLPATAFGGGRAGEGGGGTRRGRPSTCSTASPSTPLAPERSDRQTGQEKKKMANFWRDTRKMRTRSNGRAAAHLSQLASFYFGTATWPPDHTPTPGQAVSPGSVQLPPMAGVGRPPLEYELPTLHA